MDNKDTNTTGGPERYTGEMLESLLYDMMNDPPELADDDKPVQPDDVKSEKPQRDDKAFSKMVKEFIDHGGFDDCTDLYKLTFMLSFVRRSEPGKLAKALIKGFRDLSGVIMAPFDELMAIDGMDVKTSAYIAALRKLSSYYSYKALDKADVSDMELIMDHIRMHYCSSKTGARIFMINKTGKIISSQDVTVAPGTDLPFDIKKAMLAVLCENAVKSVVLVHSHEKPYHMPDEHDAVVTRRFCQMIDPVGVLLTDHFVICDNKLYSMRSMGLLDK